MTAQLTLDEVFSVRDTVLQAVEEASDEWDRQVIDQAIRTVAARGSGSGSRLSTAAKRSGRQVTASPAPIKARTRTDSTSG